MDSMLSLTSRKKLWLWTVALGLYLGLAGRLFVFAEEKTCLEAGGTYQHAELKCTVPRGATYVPLTERPGLWKFWVVLFGGPAVVLAPAYWFGKKLITE